MALVEENKGLIMVYIKVIEKKLQTDIRKNNSEKQKLNFCIIGWNCIKRFIEVLISSNSGYGSKADSIVYWYLEFEDEHSPPIREIGFDVFDNPIIIMPYNKDYGFWVDNNLTLNDFKIDFKVEEITRSVYENAWNDFKSHSMGIRNRRLSFF